MSDDSAASTRYVCVHGHAYQPPREDPATGEIDLQPSAAPFHDWNQRIDAECYGPLGAAKVLDDEGDTRLSLNLWESLSFDLGPTLGSWMDRHSTTSARLIASGDAMSGGTAAMAHPWVHAILPLTPSVDRRTIIKWGLDDFERRFGRPATGMWLPETAVDSASLEALVDAGIGWTMLAPHQVTLASGEASGNEQVIVTLPSGREIIAVVYDGALSHGVAFGGLLDDGVALATTVAGAAPSTNGRPALTIVSTDIESFGHHHRFGEMALAKAVVEWQAMENVELVNPATFLQMFPPTERGSLVERTSWSCAHGVERWRSNCGCRFQEVDGVDQAWRRPLRDALDALASVARRALDEVAVADLIDPWSARDDYGTVISAPPELRDELTEAFIERHVRRSEGVEPTTDRALMWMRAERVRLEAWSSCAWFFDSPDRIETMQTVTQANAAIDVIEELTGWQLSDWFNQQLP